MAMFPPSIPHVFIQWLTEPGDAVYDPFSGRGTTALEACLLGRMGLASDLSPLAYVLSAAKVDPPSSEVLENRISDLEARVEARDCDTAPGEIRMLFSRFTLSQLLWLREQLQLDNQVDRFLMATLAGILHANADSCGNPRGLTVAMPNTFSMAPGYVRRYIEDRDLQAPEADVFAALRTRLGRFPAPTRGFTRGRAWLQDSREPPDESLLAVKPRLIFTSPPYLKVMKYGKLNWIRLWLLGASASAVDESLFSSSSVDRYLDFVSGTLAHLSQAVSGDGYVCLVVGDVRGERSELNLAREVAEHCLAGTGLSLLGTVRDGLPVQHKVSRIWGDTRGQATRRDRILILGASQAPQPRTAGPVKWTNSWG